MIIWTTKSWQLITLFLIQVRITVPTKMRNCAAQNQTLCSLELGFLEAGNDDDLIASTILEGVDTVA